MMSQSFTDQPPLKRKTSPGVIVGIVVGALMFVVMMGVGGYFGFKAARNVMNKRAGAAPVTFDASMWGKRKVKEISVLTPCDFGPGPNVSAELPAEVREVIDAMDTFQGLGMPEDFVVMASSVAYAPEIEASLDGAVQGTMSEAAARLGDMQPKFDSKPITVSGIEARRALYTHPFQNQTMHMDTVTVCKANRLWQVQVIYLHPGSSKAADKILKSVEIEE